MMRIVPFAICFLLASSVHAQLTEYEYVDVSISGSNGGEHDGVWRCVYGATFSNYVSYSSSDVSIDVSETLFGSPSGVRANVGNYGIPEWYAYVRDVSQPYYGVLPDDVGGNAGTVTIIDWGPNRADPEDDPDPPDDDPPDDDEDPPEDPDPDDDPDDDDDPPPDEPDTGIDCIDEAIDNLKGELAFDAFLDALDSTSRDHTMVFTIPVGSFGVGLSDINYSIGAKGSGISEGPMTSIRGWTKLILKVLMTWVLMKAVFTTLRQY